VLVLAFLLFVHVFPAIAAGPTTSVTVTKLAADGTTIQEQVSVTYQWMKENLPVQGDGVTHYYHQGPVFEGDMWDPAEIENLKDKGAVIGTAVKDLCDLVGGMSRGDEVMLKAVDGWHTELAYENIYQPRAIQGPVTLCWYKGEDAESGEQYGVGYPASDAFYTGMQIVFLAGTKNPEGKYVFGNSDMKICLPDEKYQHFYEGLPSTNGLSGKWIDEIVIFSGKAPVEPDEKLVDVPVLAEQNRIPLVPVVIGSAGVVVIGGSVAFIFIRKKAG
jgi:hypothetical protein